MCLSPGNCCRCQVKEHHCNQNYRINQHTVITQSTQYFRKHGQYYGCNNGTTEASHSTEYDKYQNHDGHIVSKVCRLGNQTGKVMCLKHSACSCDCCRNGKCHQFKLCNINANGFCCNTVITDCHDGTAASGINQIKYYKQCNQNQNNTD